MKLHPENRSMTNDRRETLPVLRGGEHGLGPGRPGGQRVHVVERASSRGQAGGQRRRPLEADLVPADVGHAEPPGAQRRDHARDQTQPEGGLELLGALKQQLHAEADTEQRPPSGSG